jgi:hypothetical protein
MIRHVSIRHYHFFTVHSNMYLLSYPAMQSNVDLQFSKVGQLSPPCLLWPLPIIQILLDKSFDFTNFFISHYSSIFCAIGQGMMSCNKIATSDWHGAILLRIWLVHSFYEILVHQVMEKKIDWWKLNQGKFRDFSFYD